MLFSDWYTDTVDVFRVVSEIPGGGNLTRDKRKQVGFAIPCRVYSTQVKGAVPQPTAAVDRKEDKLACDISADIQIGDELIVTRGGRIGGTTTERYLAGKPQDFYDPVGVVHTGLDHKEVGLLADNIARS